MIFAGAGLLVSLPFFTSGGMTLWFVAKGFYLVGLVIMIIRKEWIPIVTAVAKGKDSL